MSLLLNKKCCCGESEWTPCSCGNCEDSYGFSWTNLIIQEGPPSWTGSEGDLLNDLYPSITWPRSGTMRNYMTDTVKTAFETVYHQSYDKNTFWCPDDPRPSGIWPTTYCCNLKTYCTWNDFVARFEHPWSAPGSYVSISCIKDSPYYGDGWMFSWDGRDAQYISDGCDGLLIVADGYSNGKCPATGSISGAFEATIVPEVSLSGNFEGYSGYVYPTIS